MSFVANMRLHISIGRPVPPMVHSLVPNVIVMNFPTEIAIPHVQHFPGVLQQDTFDLEHCIRLPLTFLVTMP